MTYTYANRKRTDAPQQETDAQQPSLDALRIGTAAPSPEQLGRRVDLPDAMREKMENAFGADLSAVKLYESEAVRDAGAEGVAQGNRIAFAPGMLDFSSYAGQARLGHELSHVVSQARGEVTGSGLLNDPALEARADREGAMAAAGEQIALPTASMSAVTAAPAAGPMQCLHKKGDKKNQAPPQPAVPGPAGKGIDFGKKFERLKGNDFKSNSVVKVQEEGGDGSPYALKMGTNPKLEPTLGAYHNTAARAYRKFHGKYNFDAPESRALTPAEKAKMRLKKMIGKKKGQLRSLEKGVRTEDQELDSASVYSWAEGRSRAEPGSEDAKKPGAITANPEDYMDAQEYRRTLGFIAATDMATGNVDRLAGRLNMGNWTEDRSRNQIHLIDNDYTLPGGLGTDVAQNLDRKYWMDSIVKAFGKGAREKDVGFRFMKGITSEDYGANQPEQMQSIFGAGQALTIGANQAIAALPEMRKDMAAEFTKGGATPDEFQTELLERMHILDEYTHDTRMSEIYERLSMIGFKPPEQGPDHFKEERDKLLKEIQDRRAEKERQQRQA